MKVGYFFKQVRIERGLSQKYVSESIMSQSSYSKFENDLIEIPFSNFFLIIKRLGIAPEEFLFVHQGFQGTKEQQLINRFFNLSHNNGSEIRILKDEIEKHLTKESNMLLEELFIICECLINLNENGEILILSDKISPIWERLSKSDEWYLNDIKMINVILYFFPISTAIEITKKAIRRLNRYNSFSESKHLKSILKLNLSLLLIKEGQINNALDILKPLTGEKKTLSYSILSLCYVRIAICLYRSNNPEYADYYEKSCTLTKIYEDHQLLMALEKEFNKYTHI